LIAEVVVVHFQRLQIIDGRDMPIIAAYHTSIGIDRCCMGFLKSNLVNQTGLYK